MFKIGCDPEVPVFKNGQPFPVVGLIGGTKKRPRPVACGAVQEDNVMAEINTHPAASELQWVQYLTKVLQELEGLLDKHGCEYRVQTSTRYSMDLLQTPQAQTFGCTPDYDAWGLVKNPSPKPQNALDLRTASGNIHVSWDGRGPAVANGFEKYERILMARYMDIYLGLPSVLLDPDTERRQLYGRAGAHRPKLYGVEWRTGSNFWLANPERMEWVWSATQKCALLVGTSDGDYLMAKTAELMLDVTSALNNHDVALATSLIDVLDIPMPEK